MALYEARWSELDPAAHPFDPERVRAPIEALVLEAARAGDAVDRDAVEQGIELLLLDAYGPWAAGWRWSASEPGGGGPVRGWCCARHSVLREDDPDARATIERALAAVASWRGYLDELAARFAGLRAEAAGLALEDTVERAAARLLPLVLERTGAEDAWYATFSTTLGWFLDALVGERDAEPLKPLVDGVVSGRFESWIGPDADTARKTFAELGEAVAGAEPGAPYDALAEWIRIRPDAFADATWRPPSGQVTDDGHARFIEEIDRARDHVRANRMAAALVLCRDSAGRGLALTFDQLAEWQAVVLGGSAPARFRTAPAFARGGRVRYGLHPDTQRRFEAALAEAHTPAVPVAVRAARVYLDVCFFHPFEDGNARAARLALDHVLTSAGCGLSLAEPVFVIARAAGDRRGARSLAGVIAQLAGPLAD